MKNISERALNVIKMIEEKGHQAFIVGGAVRDALLGKNPMDYDITTSALPNEIISPGRGVTALPPLIYGPSTHLPLQ